MDSAEPAGGELSADRPAASCLRCGEEEPDKEGDDAGGNSDGCSWEQSLNPELQQGYRILREFLTEKYRPLTAPFLKPHGDQASVREEGPGSLSGRNSSHCVQQSPAGMGLLKMEEKFTSGQYAGIADFVGDFRLMLETCYRLHGVDHWLSKQAQKLEMILEQKLALLSRHLREKTSIAVMSRGCYGLEDEKGTACISTRRRSTPRNLVGLSTGMFESVMVQVLRQEEQLRAKEEKRLREQERKEAEEASQKEIEEWEKSLLAQAAPTRMETMWEIPAIGHFLCLAQQILNLPEIVFYELERCLLMPQCNAFLSKIMTSLLSPPHRRSTLHRRPTLSYRTWEAALRQKVQHWYNVVGQTDNPNSSAEKLGLCPQFFKVLGEVNPLEEKPFHELSFYQKVWLLKGLCDFVYETQKDVQDAVLGQPIHECREVILGYDYLENAYVHFPQFCGADVRIYKQKPFQAPEFPSPPIKVRKVSRIKSEKVKHAYVSKNNEEVSSGGGEELLNHSKTEVEKSMDSVVTCPEKIPHIGSFRVTTEEINCEIKTSRVCDIKKTGCYKENLRDLISSGEAVGMGGHPSSGEIRAVENRQGCAEMGSVKAEITPFKENTLKACQVHVNGTHNDKQDINYHESAEETTLENTLRNKKKLNKLRAKKKKKKKKKLKDILNENLQRKLDDLQRKREIHLHPFKSYKSEIQNKLFIIKKKAKHKKHKSGKKSVSKKAITKKRKGVTKSAIPEFQLICTNLDELRELITKIEKELKDLEDIKKKSETILEYVKGIPSPELGSTGGCNERAELYLMSKAAADHQLPLCVTSLENARLVMSHIPQNPAAEWSRPIKGKGRWYHRKQAVKELHGTLIRLLNELLPWEPKLMKAFQRNRSRLKKDYDDFKRHPDHDKFTRELWSNDESEVDSGKDSFAVVHGKSSESAEHVDVPRKDHPDNDEMKLLEMNLPPGKNRILKKESASKEIHKTLPKCVKRQSKQSSCLDQSINELSPRKKAKLSTNEAVVQSVESSLQPDSSLTELKQFEGSTPGSFSLTDPATSVSNLKGTKPIQALLAKNTGNKVTLTNQLSPPPGINSSTSEKALLSSLESSLIKPVLPCQTSSKAPLQMVYKMPNGHCVPIDLHNSSVKIQMQPVIDPKTGEKVMQQVLILPKNFLIQQKEGKIVSKDIQSLQQKSSELRCTTLPEISNVSVPLTPVLVTGPANATTQSPSTIFNKNTIHLSQLAGPVNTTQPLPSVTPAGNLLSSTIKVSQTEADKIKTTVSAATLHVSLTSPTLSTASQSLIPATTLSGSTNTVSACHSLASQQTTDSFETRQELKTVCIRESQSILVTTRGGNTGIVKVRTNPDQILPGSLSSSSVFTYAPQLQTFLVPKTTSLPCSTVPSVVTATSGLPYAGQSCLSGFAPSTASSVNIPAFPADFTQAMEKNIKFTLQQPSVGGTLGQVIANSCYVSSPSLSSISSASNLMSATPNSPASVTAFGQNNTVITPNSVQQQGDTKTTTHPAIRSESNSATNGNLISGAPVQKLTLVTNPPILSPCGASGVSIIPSPASTGVNAQKLVFINTQIANGPSVTNLVAESLKHNLPSSLSKTFVSATEQPQLVLIPSTVGAPIRINSSSTIAQVKDVKIGLNIGQTIVNTKGNAQQPPPVNILHSAISKAEDKKSMALALSLTSSSALVPAPGFVSQSAVSVSASTCVATKAENTSTVTTVNACVESVSVTSGGSTSGTWPTVLIGGNDPSRIRPVLGNRLCTSNIGNSVGISTVKTGHLSSSVLISTTQPTVSPQNLASALQLPVISLTGSVATPPKVLHTVPQLAAIPVPPPVPKSQVPTLLQFQSSGVSTTLPSNAGIHKPQSLPAPSPNTSKVTRFPSFSSLQCQQVPPSTEKQSYAYTCASTVQMSAASPTVPSKAGGQLNEPCIQQKIVINTCVPLAPGTQIMINGNCFVVPPQGLGAGNHVVLLSCNTKQTTPLTINHGQEAQSVPIANPITSKIILAPSNSLSWQISKHPLKSSTKIVNSFGSADVLPVVHATPQIFSTPASSCTPLSAATLSVSSVIKSPVNLVATSSVVSAVHPPNSHLPSNTSVFHLDTSIKKLLVSPEGAILNAINTPASKVSSLSSSLPPVTVCTSRNPTTVFPPSQSSCIDKPDKAAS
ncbi:putative bromodomain-containing protein 10 isoform X2 [Opisthocomus hoazin]|uniref:putative bromodomain-containing protein 10 isoform X2 n=1 Tax=Opisthocomus hoazin TaxID=30419 RepID=UPI003F534D2B